MSDDVQSLVAALRLGNYMALVGVTVMSYDYILTLPREINYIWNQPWSWISVMFIIVRYFGLFYAIWNQFDASTRICTVVIIAISWSFLPFLAAADFVMIMRLHAMYRRSKTVLWALIVLYIPTLALYVVSTAYYVNPHTNMTVTVSQILDAFYCNVAWKSLSGIYLYTFIPRFILSAAMFILAVTRFIKEAVQTYKATGVWLSNRYVNLLVRESILYFVAQWLYNIDASVLTMFDANLALSGVILNTLAYPALFALAPRFILSVRELYMRDSCRVWRQIRGIDNGFGLSGMSYSMEAGSIRFADWEISTAGETQGSEMQVVVRTTAC